MSVRTFKRGIHPPGQKAGTNDKPIEVLLPLPGATMVYPMTQHIGAPCEPIVSVGERVLLGQKIGEARQVVSAPIHSSVSGIVKSIGTAVTPTGITAAAITIENDGLLEEHADVRPNDDYALYPREQYREMIRAAGIVGLGGAGFPTSVKLSPPPEKKIDVIIVNAAECEPYLTTDHRVLLEETDRIRIGLQIMLRLFPDAVGMIGIETNKMDAIKAMRAACKDNARIRVVPLRPKYPQGAEKQLIYACTGREVPSGGLPSDIGVLVDNVDTVIAIHRAIVRGRPLMRKVITLAGGAVKNPGNYKVRLGMRFGDLIEQAGGLTEAPYKVIAGGPMMGVALYDLDVPVIKTSSAILCLTEKEAALPEEQNCIRCGKCVDYCPAGLMPLELNQFIVRGETAQFLAYRGLDCIECGSCSYVCPAKRHLAQSIRYARRRGLAERNKT